MSPVDLKRFKVESKKRLTLPQEREPRAVKEEEALVRTLRVVRGSWNSKGVSAIDSNRERRENREQKRECSL